MNPAAVVAWISVVAELIRLGKTTYEEIAGLFASHTHGTDLESAEADNLQLLALRGIIAEQRAKAAAAAGLDPLA